MVEDSSDEHYHGHTGNPRGQWVTRTRENCRCWSTSSWVEVLCRTGLEWTMMRREVVQALLVVCTLHRGQSCTYRAYGHVSSIA